MLNNKQKKTQTFAPRRIVFRQGKNFICGMCRVEHASQKEAAHCLKACLESFTNQQPVRLKRLGDKIKFCCTICARRYEDHQSAQNCAIECHNQAIYRTNVNQKVRAKGLPEYVRPNRVNANGLAGLPGPETPDNIAGSGGPGLGAQGGNNAAAAAAAAQAKAKAAQEAKAKADEAAAQDMFNIDPSASSDQPSTDGGAGASVPGGEIVGGSEASKPGGEIVGGSEKSEKRDAYANATITPGQKQGDKDYKLGNPRAKGLGDSSDKFFRDGAKYVCNNCKKKHFTRNEVEACFDGHAKAA